MTYDEKVKIVSLFIERVNLHAKEDYAEVVFKFPSYTDTTGAKGTPIKGKDFPLVLNIRTITETERKAFILKNNPGMYIPKALV